MYHAPEDFIVTFADGGIFHGGQVGEMLQEGIFFLADLDSITTVTLRPSSKIISPEACVLTMAMFYYRIITREYLVECCISPKSYLIEMLKIWCYDFPQHLGPRFSTILSRIPGVRGHQVCTLLLRMWRLCPLGRISLNTVLKSPLFQEILVPYKNYTLNSHITGPKDVTAAYREIKENIFYLITVSRSESLRAEVLFLAIDLFYRSFGIMAQMNTGKGRSFADSCLMIAICILTENDQVGCNSKSFAPPQIESDIFRILGYIVSTRSLYTEAWSLWSLREVIPLVTSPPEYLQH